MSRELLQLQLSRYGLDLAAVRSASISNMTVINRNTDDGIYDPNFCICTINVGTGTRCRAVGTSHLQRTGVVCQP